MPTSARAYYVIIIGSMRHRPLQCSISSQQFICREEQSLVVEPDYRGAQSREYEHPQLRRGDYVPRHDEQQGRIYQRASRVELERHVVSRVDYPHPEADVIAEEGGYRSALNAPFGNEGEVEHEVDRARHERCPEAVFGMLGRGVDTAEELVQRHEQHG